MCHIKRYSNDGHFRYSGKHDGWAFNSLCHVFGGLTLRIRCAHSQQVSQTLNDDEKETYGNREIVYNAGEVGTMTRY